MNTSTTQLNDFQKSICQMTVEQLQSMLRATRTQLTARDFMADEEVEVLVNNETDLVAVICLKKGLL